MTDPTTGLTPGQRRLLRVLVALAVFVLGDTLYLLANRFAGWAGLGYFAVTEVALPGLYQAMVLLHTAAGLALAAVALAFAAWHLPGVWARRHRTSVNSGVLLVLGGLTLTVTGLFILTAANSRDNRWAFWAHLVCAAFVPALYLYHRYVSIWVPSRVTIRNGVAAVLAVALFAVLGHGLSHRGKALTEEARLAVAAGKDQGPGSRARDLTPYAQNAFLPANYVPTGSPFFPSATTTTTGDYLPSRIITRGDVSRPERLAPDLDRYGFVVNEKIGATTCERCHADIVEQWSRSAHRFASFNNPFYEATINDMRKNSTNSNAEMDAHLTHSKTLQGREAFVKSKWCSGCHDPALMLAGKMVEPIDRRTAQAQAGLTCLACHAIDKIHNQTGNGNYNIADEQEDPYLFATSQNALGNAVHDLAVKARPAAHKAQMLKPFFRTSEFCGTCHKVSLDVRLNGYRWVRGQNEFDAWHDSGVSINASRTFYLPPQKRVCQDCHMPLEKAERGDVAAKNGYVRSHRFLSVNTALPFIRGDQETIGRVEAFLKDEKLRVDVFAIRRGDVGAPIAPLNRLRPPLVAGEEISVDVVVRNKGVGHTFPGGTNDSNEGWLEFSALDAEGRPVAVNGFVRPDGHVDPEAHFYKALLVDREGNAIHRRNVQDIFTAVYVRVIGPGTADVARYTFRVPEGIAGQDLTLRARLLWRKFDRTYTEFAFRTNPAGFAGFKEVPDLPITLIAQDEVRLPLLAKGSTLPKSEIQNSKPDDWVRFNDYGIGLLLQTETKWAEWAFGQVAALAPARPDGPRNLARVAVQDGSLDTAYERLRAAERLTPGDPQTAWVWGVALQRDGRYEQAIAAYRRVLQDFPEDRAAWSSLGRILYLDGKFAAALEALDHVLEIDPEDRAAHYHRMLALRTLGRTEEAAKEEEAYLIYQIDESARQATRTYLLKHPEDTRSTQPLYRRPVPAWAPDGRQLGAYRDPTMAYQPLPRQATPQPSQSLP
ncbi:MAG: tetratricopeptide repeat protein [Candidatus Latescibacteria bacterium]|nr:tetratricopeptide repeat protein [Candidatus Latescibacterota bacterium]